MTPTRPLSRAFLAAPITCGDLQLRPVTAGSMLILQELGNPMFTGVSPDAPPPTDADNLFSIFEFIWVHSEDMEIVIELSEDPAAVRRAVKAFMLTQPLTLATEFKPILERMVEDIALAQAESIPEGKPGKSPQPSPTGLPAWSGTSAAPATPSASGTSSGPSPSYEPSSTSTPPSATMEPALDGSTSPPETLPATLPPFPGQESDG